jgi:hypothetical protein
MVAQLFAQTPKPAQVKVARRVYPSTQVITITPTNTTVGYVYSGEVNALAWTYTVLTGHNTVPEIVAGIVSAINALAVSGLTAAAVGTPVTHLTCTSTAGILQDFTAMSRYLTIVDSTIDPTPNGIATDLSAILLEDSDWYFLLIDSCGDAEIKAAAAWTEANQKLFVCQTADSDCITSATTDTLSDLQDLAYYRTCPFWHRDVSSALACGMVGNRAVATPGSDTWNLKTIVGVTPSDDLTETQTGYLDGKKGNYYMTVGNTGSTRNGWMSGGAFADTVRFLDWVRASMQVGCVNALKGSEKIPNTDEGRSVITGAILSTLTQGVKNGGFKKSPAPAVTMPPDTDETSFDAATRNLSGITWTATLANAIHTIKDITGYVTN